MLSVSDNPVLVFTWGNPSRGDDALGPALFELL
jgi:Ni,Fe-hydrogenase maturation factor